jgi:hypothetical protein
LTPGANPTKDIAKDNTRITFHYFQGRFILPFSAVFSRQRRLKKFKF